MSLLSSRRAVLALLMSSALATPLLAGPEKTKGNILTVDMQAMKVVVKHPKGYNMTLTVNASTPIKFTDGSEFFINPTVRDLAAGMYIYFTHENGVVSDIEVREIPNELRHPRQTQSQAGGSSGSGRSGSGSSGSGRDNQGGRGRDQGRSDNSSRDLKVRILNITDERRGEFRADVAGQTQSFQMSNPRDLRSFRVGDIVVLSVDRDNVVTSIRSTDR
jgi:hypothetical protein